MEQYIEPEKSYPSQNSQHTAAKSQYAKASNPQPRSACLELKKEFVHMLNSESSAGSETVLEKDFILLVHQYLRQKENAVAYFFAEEIANIVYLGFAVHSVRLKTLQNMLNVCLLVLITLD